MSQTIAERQSSPLGEILLRRGQVRKYQLDFLLKLQTTLRNVLKPISIGELLIKHRAITTLALMEALAVQEAIPTESVTQIVKGLENQPSYNASPITRVL